MSVSSDPLLSGRPLQYVLTLTSGFIVVGAQSVSSTSSSVSAVGTQALDTEDPGDGEDGDNSSTRTHSSTRAATLGSSASATGSGASSASPTSNTSAISSGSSRHGLQGGSITALVFGILVLIIIGAGLFLWLRRRRRLLAEAKANANDGSQVNTALISRDPVSVQSPTSPTSAGTAPWLPSVYMVAAPASDHGSDPEHGDQSQDNHGRASSSIHTLPNPHESYRDTPHSRSTTMRTTSMYSDRDLPPLPDSSLSLHPTSATNSLLDALSSAPSAFTYPTLASQALTSSSNATTAPSTTSVTNEEAGQSTASTRQEGAIMADYQKRLESHHRKESEEAIAGVSSLPVDPPPRYSESDRS